MVKTKQSVVIVGGGFAGVKAALELADDPNFDITLVTPHSRFEYHGAMYRSATGRSPLEVVLQLSEIFDGISNVRVQLDSVVELRPDTNEIEGESGRTYHYDHLIMAVGYVVNYFGIPGMAEYSESMYNITSAIRLRHKLVGTFRQAKPGKPVHISVIGAGPTGVEIASDIQNFAKIVEGKHGLPRIDVRVHLVEAADRVLSMLSEESSAAAHKRLEDIGVDVHVGTMVQHAYEHSVNTNQGEIESDVIIWTAGNRANPLFAAYPDIFDLSKGGRVKVDPYFASKQPNIYVIGDAADTPHSGMAQTAIHNAQYLAANLKHASQGKKLHAYKPKQPNYVIPIGGEWALLETPDGVKVGDEGWESRREADLWVLKNFLVYELAKQHHKMGDQFARDL